MIKIYQLEEKKIKSIILFINEWPWNGISDKRSTILWATKRGRGRSFVMGMELENRKTARIVLLVIYWTVLLIQPHSMWFSAIPVLNETNCLVLKAMPCQLINTQDFFLEWMWNGVNGVWQTNMLYMFISTVFSTNMFNLLYYRQCHIDHILFIHVLWLK